MIGTGGDTGESKEQFETPGEYVGYQVLDARCQKMGRVEDLLVNAGGEPEYVRVRIWPLGLRSVLIPAGAVWVNRRRRLLMLLKEPNPAHGRTDP